MKNNIKYMWPLYAFALMQGISAGLILWHMSGLCMFIAYAINLLTGVLGGRYIAYSRLVLRTIDEFLKAATLIDEKQKSDKEKYEQQS
jgi:hypothetical protein